MRPGPNPIRIVAQASLCLVVAAAVAGCAARDLVSRAGSDLRTPARLLP